MPRQFAKTRSRPYQTPANASISGQDVSGELESVTYTNYVTPTTIRLVKEGPAGTVLLDARATQRVPANVYARSRYWIDPRHSYVTLQYQYSDLKGRGR